MNKQRRWLLREIDRWTADALVTPEQAARIRARYPEQPGAPWGMIAFSGIGAIVLGLGVILLFAYNWDAIPRLVKLALIVGATGGAHAAGLMLRERDGWQVQLGEVISLLGTMFFGAGIWLVAQIYHIEEHYPNGYLFWGLGALAMAWALLSVPQALLAAVTLTIWAGSEVAGFANNEDFVFVLLAAGLGPIALRRRSVVLLAAVLVSLYVLLIMIAGQRGGSPTGFLAVLSFSVLLIAGGHLLGERNEFTRLGATMRFFGWTAFVLCCYLLTFEGMVDDLLDWRTGDRPAGALAWVYRWGLFVAALGVAAWHLRTAWAQRQDGFQIDHWLAPALLLFAQVLVTAGGEFELLAFVIFNIATFCLAATWMVQGCKEGVLSRTVVGSLLLAAVVLARFFDLFDSLAVRGLVFVVLGAILFAEGFYYRKLRRGDPREVPQ